MDEVKKNVSKEQGGAKGVKNEQKAQKRCKAKTPKALMMLASVTIEAYANAKYFVSVTTGYIVSGVELLMPYAMYVAGLRGYKSKMLLAIPLIAAVVIFYVRGFMNRMGKGSQFPVPAKRFTETNADGEVSVDRERLQELLLYVADVEDYLASRGMLK